MTRHQEWPLCSAGGVPCGPGWRAAWLLSPSRSQARHRREAGVGGVGSAWTVVMRGRPADHRSSFGQRGASMHHPVSGASSHPARGDIGNIARRKGRVRNRPPPVRTALKDSAAELPHRLRRGVWRHGSTAGPRDRPVRRRGRSRRCSPWSPFTVRRLRTARTSPAPPHIPRTPPFPRVTPHRTHPAPRVPPTAPSPGTSPCRSAPWGRRCW